MTDHPAASPPTTYDPREAARLTRAAVATGAVFATSGMLAATWFVRIPAMRDQLDAGPAELGLALLGAAVGSLAVMPVTGRLCARWGSRRVVAVAAAVASVALAVIPYAPNVAALGVLLAVWGTGFGSWDVAMNVHGSIVERRAGRAWMPRYHALWSAGGILGGAVGAVLAGVGVGPRPHLGGAAVVILAVCWAALRSFVDDGDPARGRAAQPTPARPAGRLLSRRLLALGLITAGATCVEGAAADWLPLYLADERSAGPGWAAAGYTVFAAAMAAGRMAGTSVLERLGRGRAVRGAGLLTGLGIVATLVGPGLAGAYAGVVLWGLGVALVFPAAMSAAGETPGRSGDAIAAVSTIGYSGFLVGPPLVGFLAEVSSLGRALFALLALTALVVALAPAARDPRRGR